MNEIQRERLLKQPSVSPTIKMTTTDSSDPRPIILCFVAYYLPGYRFGGPVRTIANFVAHLGNEFDIRIVTRDRDALDTQPYSDVEMDNWNTMGKAQVFYASGRTMNLRGIARLIRETPHDVLYLNSFFAAGFTILPLLARRLGLIPNKPCVIAPRGEFSRGAIALKAWKKRPYIALSKALGLYSDLRWQASSAFEVHDIQRVLSVDAAEITIAPNLPPVATRPTDYIPDPPSREPGPLRIIFLSRISPMKNLDYLLRVLAKISRPVELSIMGPIDAPGYWEECRVLIKALPGSISVTYAGEVEHKSVAKVFSEHDLFVFPTRGENFGHVIYESLAAGTPVMLSDQTPWVADGEGSLEILPLSDPRRWVEAIGKWARLDEQAFATRRTAALQYARQVPKNSTALEQNRALFQLAASSV